MEGLGSLLLFAVAFFLLMRFGCGSHMIHGYGSHGHSGNDNSDSDNRGSKYIDPVCNMEVETEQGYGKMHHGTLYRFCSKDCLDKFDSNPDRYLDKQQLMIEEKQNDH